MVFTFGSFSIHISMKIQINPCFILLLLACIEGDPHWSTLSRCMFRYSENLQVPQYIQSAVLIDQASHGIHQKLHSGLCTKAKQSISALCVCFTVTHGEEQRWHTWWNGEQRRVKIAILDLCCMRPWLPNAAVTLGKTRYNQNYCDCVQ